MPLFVAVVEAILGEELGERAAMVTLVVLALIQQKQKSGNTTCCSGFVENSILHRRYQFRAS